jgi:hypothetical protein
VESRGNDWDFWSRVPPLEAAENKKTR